MKLPLALVASAAALLCQTVTVNAGTDDHKYKKGEHIELWVSKVGCAVVAAVITFTINSWIGDTVLTLCLCALLPLS